MDRNSRASIVSHESLASRADPPVLQPSGAGPLALRPPARERGVASADQRPDPCEASSATPAGRAHALGGTAADVEPLAGCPPRSPARDRRGLASEGLPALLDRPLASAGPAEAGHTGSQAHRPDGVRESDLGCAAHPRRALEAWLRALGAHGVAVSAADPAGQRSAPRVGDVPSESPRGVGRDGLLHGAYRDISSPDHLVPDSPRAPEDRPLRYHGAPDRTLGGAATSRIVPVRDRAVLLGVRPRFDLLAKCDLDDSGHGHRAEADRSAESLAERRRRALDRELPGGAIGSRGDSERAPSPAPPSGLPRLLCPRSLPSRAGQGRSGHALGATATEWPSPSRGASPAGRPPSPLRLARSRVKTARTPPLRTRLRASSLLCRHPAQQIADPNGQNPYE